MNCENLGGQRHEIFELDCGAGDLRRYLDEEVDRQGIDELSQHERLQSSAPLFRFDTFYRE